MSSLQSNFGPAAATGPVADMNRREKRTILAGSVREAAQDGVLLTTFGYRDANTTRIAPPAPPQ